MAMSEPIKDTEQMNTTQAIYEAFVEMSGLSLPHRAELRKKRGFTDQTIDTFRLISGGDENVLRQLAERFPPEDLLRSGVYQKINDVIQPSPMLLDRRIVIPYLDEERRVTLLRPHKLGLKDVDIQVYCAFLLRNRPKEIVLTEGEFKAMALWQWGIPGIAIPGISSCAGKHFDRLVELLKRFGVESVTVVFDNEIKDDPQYPNYKEKPEDRWDTPFWAYVMAYKLHKHAGLSTRVGKLPDAWRQNGKIDFDGALAAGKTADEIRRVIAAAKLPGESLSELPEEGERIVRRKIGRYFFRSPVRREHNRYVITRTNGQNTYDEQVSNFVVNIKSSFYSSEGCMRQVQFVNEFGETSDTFILEPSHMAGVTEFRKFCFGRGNYVFEGKGSDLTEIWKYELMRDTGQLIYMPEQIGEIQPGFWLFGNVSIKRGKVYRPDADGIFWVDNVGYKPQSLNVGPRGETYEDAIPALYTGPVDIEEVARLLKASIGGYEAYLGIGWVIATIFSRIIFQKHKAFPFLFPHGKRESGKSTFMRWLMAFFGVETEGYALSDCTQVFICRSLAYYSSLGVWFDEYRNEARITAKDGYLRSAYNRQLSGKGIKESFGARSYRVAGTVAISGEEMPQDNGLFTRCCFVQLSANRRDRELFDTVNRLAEKFSGFTFYLIKHYDELAPRILESIGQLKEALAQEDITDRTAENWAVMAGAFDAVVGHDPGFIRWVFEQCQAVKKSAEEEHMLNVFWSDVTVLESQGELGLKHLKALEDGTFAFWFPAVYSCWAEHYRRRTGKEPFDRLSILKYMQDEPYYVDVKTVRLQGSPRKCHIINPEKAPDEVQELAERAAIREAKEASYGQAI